MLNRRNFTGDIWRAVVVAGAMLGAGGCSSKKPAEEPAKTELGGTGDMGDTGGAVYGGTGYGAAEDPCNPCGRPRTDDEERPTGRGFILA